ncbi:MAG: ketoacyl-ACP synthase III [Deltaproteobacteria bacterium]|nr:ketoacyl-ACP synthase III [Deltaproteobacteria bacterium]
MGARKIGILGTGSYAPQVVLTNQDLEKLVDTTDQWIRERTGIIERRICGPEETVATMALEAARRALDAAGLTPDRLSYIIVGTNTPDYLFPAIAIRIQDALGVNSTLAAFDLQAGCTGFNYGLYIAERLVAPEGKYALIIGSDASSRFTDWTDRSTCVLFGDGAGAAVLGPVARGGIIAQFVASSLNMKLYCETEFNAENSPFQPRQLTTARHFLKMDGPEIFKFAVKAVRESIRRISEITGIPREEFDYFIIHQANNRIIEAAARFARVPMEKFFVNVHCYGNTSAASVPLALDEAVRAGKLKVGDKVFLCSFGAGVTWSAALMEWGV